MRVHVLHRLVKVLVVMPLDEMQPKADRHQHAGKAKLPGHSIAEDQEREERTDEAGVLARPSRPVEKPE